MHSSRRQFLRNGSLAAFGAFSLRDVRNPLACGSAADHRFVSTRGARSFDQNRLDDADLVRAQMLAARAVDAARSAGATYADVRLTRRHMHALSTWLQSKTYVSPVETQEVAIGVRALYNGYWGFASSPYWTDDEATRLANEAVSQAKINATGKPQSVDLGTVPRVDRGMWQSPMQIDPFTISFDEQIDAMRSLLDDTVHLGQTLSVSGTWASALWGFEKSEKVFANTEGSQYTQTFCTGYLTIDIATGPDVGKQRLGGWAFQLPLAHRGWEDFIDPEIRTRIPEWIESAERQKRILTDVKPLQPSRYDVVFDASSIAKILGNTIGQSTELDRALGYEANSDGTSYLDAPLDMLGTYRVASDLLTVTANRSTPKDLATVQWDDEGVAPESFTIVEKGILNDFQTTRESATWLAPWYKKQGKPVRSHGCSHALSAYDIPMQHVPNLVMQPASSDIGWNDLVSGVKRGVAVFDAPVARARVDQQGKFGYGVGFSVREIVDGKLGAFLKDPAFLFEATEFWKKLKVIGGPQTTQAIPMGTSKGEPKQTSQYTLRAVPAMFTDVAVVDATRTY